MAGERYNHNLNSSLLIQASSENPEHPQCFFTIPNTIYNHKSSAKNTIT